MVIFGGRQIIIPSDFMRVTSPKTAAAAGNGLLNNLIAYWPGNEASGDALDLHTNALTLTDTNTVTSATGLVYAKARQYTAANTEYHKRAGDDALLSVGDTDFTLAQWVYFDTLAAVQMMMGKDNETTREYRLDNVITTKLFRFRVFNGAAVGTVSATTLGAASTATWYLAVAWHDSIANTVSIQINGGTVDSAATTGVPADTAQAFSIGAANNGLSMLNGRIGPTMFWKSAAGAGGVLTADQRTALYNAGAGLAYASFTT